MLESFIILQSDWLRYVSLSANCVQWLKVIYRIAMFSLFFSKREMIRSKFWITDLLKRLKEGYS